MRSATAIVKGFAEVGLVSFMISFASQALDEGLFSSVKSLDGRLNDVS
jgi:hypothetical protein